MRYFSVLALGLVAACVQTPAATPDQISFDYDPRFWTKFMMRQSAADHCGEQGKVPLLLSDLEKADNTGDRIVTFRCVDPETAQ